MSKELELLCDFHCVIYVALEEVKCEWQTFNEAQIKIESSKHGDNTDTKER